MPCQSLSPAALVISQSSHDQWVFPGWNLISQWALFSVQKGRAVIVFGVTLLTWNGRELPDRCSERAVDACQSAAVGLPVPETTMSMTAGRLLLKLIRVGMLVRAAFQRWQYHRVSATSLGWTPKTGPTWACE